MILTLSLRAVFSVLYLSETCGSSSTESVGALYARNSAPVTYAKVNRESKDAVSSGPGTDWRVYSVDWMTIHMKVSYVTLLRPTWLWHKQWDRYCCNSQDYRYRPECPVIHLIKRKVMDSAQRPQVQVHMYWISYKQQYWELPGVEIPPKGFRTNWPVGKHYRI